MRRLLVCWAAAVLLAGAAGTAAEASLLETRFGVTLAAGDYTQGDVTFHDVFVHDWQPTIHAGTADFVVDDWYGKDVLSFSPWITLFGSIPSGGEPFDVEAIYLDNDEELLYLSIVTSFPPEGFTHPDVPGIHVPPGDIAIGLGGGMYDFGIDVDDGTLLLYGTDVSNWYVWDASHAVPAEGELTHFAGAVPIGPVSLTYASAGVVENEFDTYLLEVTVPLAYLGDPLDGTPIYVHWVCGCRNDATGSNAILKLVGDIDRTPLAAEPETWSSIKAQFR